MSKIQTIRSVDGLGRIVIPVAMRRALNLREGEKVNIELENAVMTIRKVEQVCDMCGKKSGSSLNAFQNITLCPACISKIKQQKNVSELDT